MATKRIERKEKKKSDWRVPRSTLDPCWMLVCNNIQFIFYNQIVNVFDRRRLLSIYVNIEYFLLRLFLCSILSARPKSACTSIYQLMALIPVDTHVTLYQYWYSISSYAIHNSRNIHILPFNLIVLRSLFSGGCVWVDSRINDISENTERLNDNGKRKKKHNAFFFSLVRARFIRKRQTPKKKMPCSWLVLCEL